MKSHLCNCSQPHCCLTCVNFGGALESIPTRLVGIECKVETRKNQEISLHIGSWPIINGKLEKKCKFWAGE